MHIFSKKSWNRLFLIKFINLIIFYKRCLKSKKGKKSKEYKSDFVDAHKTRNWTLKNAEKNERGFSCPVYGSHGKVKAESSAA